MTLYIYVYEHGRGWHMEVLSFLSKIVYKRLYCNKLAFDVNFGLKKDI